MGANSPQPVVDPPGSRRLIFGVVLVGAVEGDDVGSATYEPERMNRVEDFLTTMGKDSHL